MRYLQRKFDGNTTHLLVRANTLGSGIKHTGKSEGIDILRQRLTLHLKIVPDNVHNRFFAVFQYKAALCRTHNDPKLRHTVQYLVHTRQILGSKMMHREFPGIIRYIGTIFCDINNVSMFKTMHILA